MLVKPRAAFPRVCAVAVTVGVTVSACGGGGSKKVTLPPTSSGRPAGSASATATLSAEDAAQKAYIDSFPIAREAVTAPPDKIRSLLAQVVAPGPYLDFLVRNDLELQDKGQVPWGSGIVPHPTKVEVSGSNATIHDCQDASNAGMADKTTGRLVPSTRGNAHTTATAKLVLGSDQRWLLTEIRTTSQPCSRPA